MLNSVIATCLLHSILLCFPFFTQLPTNDIFLCLWSELLTLCSVLGKKKKEKKKKKKRGGGGGGGGGGGEEHKIMCGILGFTPIYF